MKDRKLVEKWLRNTPGEAPVDVVKGVLRRHFGEDAIRRKTKDTHQYRVKHPALADMGGFGPYGHLSVPVEDGQRVKGYYLRRIAEAIGRLEEAAHEEGEK